MDFVSCNTTSTLRNTYRQCNICDSIDHDTKYCKSLCLSYKCKNLPMHSFYLHDKESRFIPMNEEEKTNYLKKK